MNNSKLEYLNSKEIYKSQNTEILNNKKKFFITFPYPYMNGKLHLGHLFSISKSEFYSNFKKLQNYNVLFPFAFHCTGMPIVASALKLKEELENKKVDVSVKNILLTSDLPIKNPKNTSDSNLTDLEKFTDPYFWTSFFPPLAKKTLVNFHANIDWSRSFITTDINFYYDVFIKYQFNKLKRLDLVKFGKRLSIFSIKDNQACLDHDRRKGEGKKPKKIELNKILIKNFNLENKIKTLKINSENSCDQNFILLKKKEENLKGEFNLFEFENKFYLLNEFYYRNLKYQKDLRFIDKFKLNEEIEHEKLKETFSLFIPEDEIISRSGDICVVALLDQYYLDYSNKEWKEKSKECVLKMKANEDTKKKLLEALNWINKWNVSRSFGLGTKLPFDEKYIIDSLSDSTIYMSFYTFKNYLFKDLKGEEEIYKKKYLTEDFYKFIFSDIEETEFVEKLSKIIKDQEEMKNHMEIAKKCKNSFNYFYPVDLRVSGKDLIKNHLIFFIMNHTALFNKKNWPTHIFTNGHLLLNNKKMSKSEGNFLTVDKCIEKYGVSSTRMCLASCGDTNEDANFLENNANSMILKLYKLVADIETLTENIKKNYKEKIEISNLKEKDMTYSLDLFVLNALYKNIKLSLNSHENLIYSDVLKYSFYENLHLLEFYLNLSGNNENLIKFIYENIVRLIYPLVPSLSLYLFKLLEIKEHLPFYLSYENILLVNLDKLNFDKLNLNLIDQNLIYTNNYLHFYNYNDNYVLALEYIKNIFNKIKNNKNNKILIKINKNYCNWKTEIMKKVDILKEENISDKNVFLKDCSLILSKFKINKKKGIIFCMDYLNYKEKYIFKFDEKILLEEYKKILEINNNKIFIEEDYEMCEPYKPIITIE